ncbi:MAG: response regulator, partial [Proteobacteria bacterium]|nr:response regulator [Pseudomonadota bacterium]
MEKKPLHLLILEDNPDDAELAVKELEREGFTIEWSRVDTEEGFREALSKKPDLILADYKLPSFNGMAALKMNKQLTPEIPLIIFSGTIGEEFAVECITSGATDYVLKDRLFRLGPAVKRALEEAEEHRARKRAEKHIQHLNSVLKAIRRVNQLAVFEKDRDILLQKTCDALIEARGYDGAWLGFLKDKKTFARVVGSGLREDVYRFIEHVMGGDHPPCIKNALAQKHMLMIVDKSKVCGDCFYKNACTGREAAIIRVEHAGRFFGLLAILFASDVTADEEEKGLLKEVAGDIAFALHDMEMEEKQKQAEEALQESEEKMRTILNSMPDVVLQLDTNLEILWANKATIKLNPHA